jgi:hypothetical protein
MAIDLKINDFVYKIPTEWKEVTVKQFIELTLNADDLNAARILAIFTGMDFNTLINLPIEHFNLLVLPEMQFIGTKWDMFEQKRAKVINIDKYEFEPIADPSRERLGQKLYMQQLVNNAIEKKVNHLELICPVVACYYAPYVHPEKKWEERHVKDFEKLVENASIVEIYPEANFFLNGYLQYLPKRAMY